MTTTSDPTDAQRRRALTLGLGLLASGLPLRQAVSATSTAADEALPVRLLREGGVVVAFRHALAPGTFDPPEFRLGDCSTQRNLNDTGRTQARRLGEWFRTHGLKPARVRSSPWCRCMDTATLAFGEAEAWDPLSSPRSGDDAANQRRIEMLREQLQKVPAGRFEAWVSHQFTLSALVGQSTSSGEGLLLRWRDGAPEVIARLPAL